MEKIELENGIVEIDNIGSYIVIRFIDMEGHNTDAIHIDKNKIEEFIDKIKRVSK